MKIKQAKIYGCQLFKYHLNEGVFCSVLWGGFDTTVSKTTCVSSPNPVLTGHLTYMTKNKLI